MKSIILITAIITMTLQVAEAQYNDTSLGVRIGQGDGTSIEISYNTPLARKSNKRINITSGITFGNTWNAITNYGIGATYEIVNYIDAGWQWHYGVGLSSGMSTYIGPNIIKEEVYNGDTFFNLGVVPVIGIEKHYKKSPFNIAIEIKPNIPVINMDYSFWGTIGFALHYRFN